MSKVPVCPYCNSDVNIISRSSSLKCAYCGNTVRIFNNKLYKSEEIPPEVAYCFVGIFANIAREHNGYENEFRNFLENFLRNQTLTKKQYEFLINFYNRESKKALFIRHENIKNLVKRLKSVIDDTCATMPMNEQESYEDSVLKVIVNFIKKGVELNENEIKFIEMYRDIFKIDDKRFNAIYNEKFVQQEEKSLKSISMVFDDIQRNMENSFYKKKCVSELVLAFKRPFVLKPISTYLKNIIAIFSSETVFVEELINNIFDLLKAEGILMKKPKFFDFNMYKNEETFGNFVNEFCDTLNFGSEIIAFENFENACEPCKDFIKSICKFGRVEVNTPKGLLEIKTFDEYFIFLNSSDVQSFKNELGSDIFEMIKDVIYVEDFSDEEINYMIEHSLKLFENKCKNELGLLIECAPDVMAYIKRLYNPRAGINGVNLLIQNKIYEPISEYKLKGKLTDNIKNVVNVVDDKFVVTFNDTVLVLCNSYENNNNEKLVNVKKKIFNMVGLDEVKNFLLKLENNILAQQMRKRAGMKVAQLPLNMIFTGNPGTGKTTVARIVAEYLSALGVLGKGQLIEVSRADLIGSHNGETGIMTYDKLTQALGGVIFIDEASSLIGSANDSYGRECIDTLIKFMEDNRENLVVIIAGYKDEIDELLSSEPALKSRFPNIIDFKDYTASEMYKIAEYIAQENEYKIDKNCYEPLVDFFETTIYKGKNPNGNARLVRNVIETSITKQAVRIVNENETDYSLLKLQDFDLKQDKEFDLETSLNQIVGLDEVKNFLRNQYSILKAQEKRKNLGIDVDVTQSLNMIFKGDPGTGKTTVARLFAQMLKEMGFLRSGQLIECSRADLVAEYVGQTAQKVTEVFNKALGGVLFIDEAYSLSRGSENDFGAEAIDALIKLMEDHRGEIVVILAGYEKEMNDFMKANSGLESRFPIIVNFKDYSADELDLIFDKMIEKRGFKISENARKLITEKIEFLKKKEVTQSGNARMIRNLIDEIVRTQSDRIAKMDDVSLNEVNLIIEEDVNQKDNVAESKYDYEKEFENIVGLESVKQYIRMLAARIKIANERKKLGLIVNEEQSLHMIFEGNPGTGKTMMARIVANMLYNLGVISDNKLVETDRAGLVAPYVGQTAIKTTEKVKEAFNGVLFIDEAYSLSQGGNADFGKEAIDTLIKLMDDNRDKLLVILAGYTKEMKEFLDVNSGLLSRFPNIIEFEDYSIDELITIAKNMYAQNGYVLTEGAIDKFKQKVKEAKRDTRFGNGRFVRNVFERSVNNQALRLSNEKNIDAQMLTNILPDDIN